MAKVSIARSSAIWGPIRRRRKPTVAGKWRSNSSRNLSGSSSQAAMMWASVEISSMAPLLTLVLPGPADRFRRPLAALTDRPRPEKMARATSPSRKEKAMRIPRRGLLSVAVTVLVLALGASAGLAQGSAKGRVYRAYLHEKAADQARQARMDARTHTRSSARPAGRSSTSGASATAKDVEQIAEDTLKGHGGEKDTQVEPDMAMDPNNEDNLVAVMQQGRYRSGASVDPGFSASLDGGQTWTDGNLPGLTVAVGGPFRRASDPTVIFGPDHTVYASTIALSFTHCLSAVSVQSSNDGGLNWDDPVFPENDATCDIFNDKNWLGVDTNPASPFFGRLYLVWSQFTPTASPAVLRYSDDEGQTWSDLRSEER